MTCEIPLIILTLKYLLSNLIDYLLLLYIAFLLIFVSISIIIFTFLCVSPFKFFNKTYLKQEDEQIFYRFALVFN